MCVYLHGSFHLWFISGAVSYFSRKSEVLKWSVGRSHVQFWTRVLCYDNYFFIFLLSSDKYMGTVLKEGKIFSFRIHSVRLFFGLFRGVVEVPASLR